MLAPALAVDLSGVWTPRQAAAVHAACDDEAAACGLRIVDVDVTVAGDACPWFLLQIRCVRHDWVIGTDEACELCLAEETVALELQAARAGGTPGLAATTCQPESRRGGAVRS